MRKMKLQRYPESHLGSSAQKWPIAFPLLFTIKMEEVSILLLDLGPKGPKGPPNGPKASPKGPARWAPRGERAAKCNSGMHQHRILQPGTTKQSLGSTGNRGTRTDSTPGHAAAILSPLGPVPRPKTVKI